MREDQKNCTAKFIWNSGATNSYKTESCKTKSPLIDDGGNLEGDRDDFVCPDCGKHISIYHGA